MQDLAAKRGGKCLSTTYQGSQARHLWECAKGHRWEALTYNIRHGRWCFQCAGTKKLTLEQMQRLAEKQEGKCLSTSYRNTRSKLLWECAEGHRWEMTPLGLLYHERRCPTCASIDGARFSKSIVDMRQLAAQREGKCLSTSYRGANTKLLWECLHGHQWMATTSSVARGTWCGICAGNVAYTIEAMQKVAAERGGKCLSAEYQNNLTKLLWECSEGHRWEAMPMKVLKGTWCRKCHNARRTAASKRGASK